MLIVGGGVQVCDFGLANIVGAARSTAAAMGTIAYVAPEALEGKPSGSTDQYCLAVSYYEMRTGALPYLQETASAVMKAVVDGKLDFSKVPDAEKVVLLRATAKSPGNRFPSAVFMVAELRKATAGGPGDPIPSATAVIAEPGEATAESPNDPFPSATARVAPPPKATVALGKTWANVAAPGRGRLSPAKALKWSAAAILLGAVTWGVVLVVQNRDGAKDSRPPVPHAKAPDPWVEKVWPQLSPLAESGKYKEAFEMVAVLGANAPGGDSRELLEEKLLDSVKGEYGKTVDQLGEGSLLVGADQWSRLRRAVLAAWAKQNPGAPG